MRRNYFILLPLFFVSCACRVEFPEDLKDIIIHIHNVCVKKTGVTESEISDCEHGKFSDRNELKCYMFCLMEEASFVDDGGLIDFDMLISMIPEEWKEKVSEMITACRHHDVAGKDGCVRAFDVHKCLYKTAPDVCIIL
ncbi:general odorant-binding protein 83a-like [Arctopsyche grandis]|uniref:general odorant-binding protein 83a-like n=1 Tax=Arctopsyche grandis TaxID=121162 RepID=UPI00406D8586